MPECPHCGSTNVRKSTKGLKWVCRDCKRFFMPEHPKPQTESEEEQEDRDALDGMSNEESEEEEDGILFL